METPFKSCDKNLFEPPIAKYQNFTLGLSARKICRFTKNFFAGPPLEFKYLSVKKKKFDHL